ncbi:MAG TPA: hypothetical protein EYP68_05260, partial [Candidatus Korarchaeota archaeon]|nr:hypothetical protein [Candidatus Korarchaeota archaeon]
RKRLPRGGARAGLRSGTWLCHRRHPMEDKHYIEWIELITNGKVYRKFLNPGEGTEVIFEIKPEKFVVREYCNIHGLWTAEEE